ncbi:putative capsular associated protein [Neofusicoccum parvum UCRNP2]|uniref:Putative capsular associated protein n=1 Tax=Botryosphaeria parva (strain UCR-NP2) TaxID=1287680 RepID=R1GXR9_BOTPV|nr:putative capsular associated protein [Neofusicoccum parvum UCRNP2]
MLDGIVQMIDKFGKWLPDMDLAFNLNNECRVAVPYEDMEVAKADAETSFSNEKKSSELVNDFTTDRAFFANWTMASDICYQPDLADLHGFYTSPNIFIGTHRLMPVFSQSKAPGFSDILYPSAWNYMNRVAYAPTDEHPDPPFDDKQNTLFWRGATSEGFATAESTAWHGMTRQRMVHTLSLATEPQVLPLKHPIASYRRKQRYVALPPSLLHGAISTDISFASIARCAEPTCGDERAHFGVNPGEAKTDFQTHWQHRLLLDADGAGFSGRFLAFLHSRSLPLKVAPLFREWWHGRVSPWLHFVPLDPRLQGLWATAAFFQGFKAEVAGKEVEMAPREKEGRRIAEEGREWAGKALRAEDMEVYFFRLLLEWGRVTDDGREGIGFVAKKGE